MTLVEQLADTIDRLEPGSLVIVAIDGPDAAGKTTLADAVAMLVGRPTFRVSIDDWHNPRTVRLRRGDESPVGYYMDSFDYDALTTNLLDPFRAGATSVQTSHFDFRADRPAAAAKAVDSHVAALLLDGVFLLRPELVHQWDLSVYLHVPESVTLARAVVRDAEHLGAADQVRHRYERRYLPGQALYRAAASPVDKADVVIDNSDSLSPQVLRWVDRR